jgi:hypothetical protein
VNEFEFAECFFPIAKFRWPEELTMKKFARDYFKTLRYFPKEIVTEVCHQFEESVDLFRAFPAPAEMKFRCWALHNERHQFKMDPVIGSRPQDLQARAEFYETVLGLAKKHGNKAPDGFSTVLMSVHDNSARELHNMDSHHKLHGKD